MEEGAAPPSCASGSRRSRSCSWSASAIGVYHSGVEWKWWPGPQDCSGPINSFGSAGDLLRQMQATSVVRCDEVQFRFLGLSLAGYNALICLALAAVSAWGLVRRRAV